MQDLPPEGTVYFARGTRKRSAAELQPKSRHGHPGRVGTGQLPAPQGKRTPGGCRLVPAMPTGEVRHEAYPYVVIEFSLQGLRLEGLRGPQPHSYLMYVEVPS